MSRSAVELDFFRIEKETSPKPHPSKLFDRRRSFQDIQSVISKINPDLLKTLIASGSANTIPMATKSPSSSTPKHFPVYAQTFEITAPLTIFYNGTVAVFNVPRDKAESILKLAEGGGSSRPPLESTLEASSVDERELLDGDFPQPRKKSLQRFLEKRKERLTMVAPYNSFSGQSTHPQN